MRYFKKKLAALSAGVLLLFNVCTAAPRVSYEYSSSAVYGEVRYVAQIKTDEYYYDGYWGKFKDYSSNECGTACISMALSYLGIECTPEELGDYWIMKGYTQGTPFSTVFYDVPYASGGHTYDFFAAFERYKKGEASPVIIYFTRKNNPYMSGNRHFVMLTEKVGEDEYIAVDPASSKERRVTVRKNDDGTLTVGTLSKQGTFITDTETEAELCSAQYTFEGAAQTASAEIAGTEESVTEQSIKSVAEPLEQPDTVKAEETVKDEKKEAATEFEKEAVKEEAVKETKSTVSVNKEPYNAAARKIAAGIIKYAE